MLDRIKKLPKEVKASVAFFLASVVSKGISYITVPIYTRLLTTEEYGQVSLFTTWMSVLGVVAMFCLSYGVFNNGMLDYKKDRNGYTLSMLALSNIITLIFGIVCLLLYPIIKDFIGIDFPLIIVMFAVFLTQPAYNFFIARKRYEYEYKSTFAFTVLSAVLSSAISVICILTTTGSRLYARILGTELTLIAIYAGFYIYTVLKAGGKINISYWKGAVLFNLPLIPHYLSTYLLGSSDKLMISYLINDTATAYYSVAYSVASIATIVWSAINGSLVPFTYEKCRSKNYKDISKVTIPILFVFALLSVVVILLAPEVVAIMATSQYQEAIYVIPPVVGGVFFQVCYYIYANIIYYHKKTKYVMYASVTSVALNIILNYIFIPKFGYIAAGYTTLISYLIQAALDYLAMKKVVQEEVYDMKLIGALSFAVILIAIFSNFIYDYSILRYCILCVAAIVCIINKDKLLTILSVLLKKSDT